jgi:Predicted transcriptional regulators
MPRKYVENPNSCTIVHAMNIIGSKWKPIIVYLLAGGELRFGKFLILMPTISKKVLTHQLKEMEDDGLIVRKSYSEIPPRVEYSLSERGLSLLPILKELSIWTANSYPEIEFEKCRVK